MYKALFVLGVALGVMFALLTSARGDDFKLIELSDVAMDYYHFDGGARNPLFYNTEPKEQIDLTVSNSILRYGGMDATIHSMTNQSKFYVVGLKMFMYARITDYLTVGRHHFSKHLLEDVYPYQRFPVEDAWVISVKLFSSPAPKNGIF